MKRSELRSDPEKVRAWQDKSRKPLKTGVRKRRATIPPDVRASVKARSGGWCIVCLYRKGYEGGVLSARQKVDVRILAKARTDLCRIAHLHHVLPVQSFPIWDRTEDNLVGVCAGCHDEHERAHRRIPYEALPRVVRLFAQNAGTREADFLQRTYPQ